MSSDYQDAMNTLAKDKMFKLSNGEIVQVMDTSGLCKARKPNWTEQEIRVLIEEHEKLKHLLKVKQGGTTTTADKQNAWATIAAGVNNMAAKECYRTVREVQKKWENLTSKLKLELEQYRVDSDFRLSTTSKQMLATKARENDTYPDNSAILNIPDCGMIKMEPIDDEEEMKSSISDDSSCDTHTRSSESKPPDCVPVKLIQIPPGRKVPEQKEQKTKLQTPQQLPVSTPEFPQYQPILPKPPSLFTQMSDSLFVCATTQPQPNVTKKLQNVLVSRSEKTTNAGTQNVTNSTFREKVVLGPSSINGSIKRKQCECGNSDSSSDDKVTQKLKRQVLLLKKKRLKSDIERIGLEKERLKLEKEKLKMEKETVALAKEKITLELANIRNILPLSYKP